MKKFAILAALAITALGFTSCSDDNTPVYQQPAEGSFVLNTPALANQTYDLATSGPVVLTTSQPDYGFTASVSYSGQMAVVDPATNPDVQTYNLVSDVPTSTVVSFKPEDIATGMCVLNGIANENDWAEHPVGEGKVWIRLLAQLGDFENTQIASNWVCLNNVVPYFAVPQPGKIYLVGNCSGWVTPDEGNAEAYADWTLSEPEGDGIGSKIYYGTFELPEAPMFRFYTKLNGWGDDGCPWCLGAQAEDNAVDFEEFTGEAPFMHELVNGKGSFNFPNFKGGLVTIIVNANTMELTIMMGEEQ